MPSDACDLPILKKYVMSKHAPSEASEDIDKQ
jgi:hypothetical protein